MDKPKDKPKLKLTGVDGNAFVVLGAAQSAARKAGMPEEQWEAIMTEAMSGNYNHLLATLMNHFEVE